MSFDVRNIAESYVTTSKGGVADAVSFIESKWGLGVTLKPAQKFIVKCFYGLELDAGERNIEVPNDTNSEILYKFNEKEFLRWLYDTGRCNTKETEGKSFIELVLVAGRRAGKTLLCGTIADYEIYKLIRKGNPNAYYGFPNSEQISVVAAGPTDEQAGDTFREARNFSLICPYLRDRVSKKTQNIMHVKTDEDLKLEEGKISSIAMYAAGCSSNSIRGKNAVLVILDEMAFFVDNGGRFSGDQVYKALTPSISNFKGEGRIICASSPNAKYGKFYDKYNESFNETEETLMFKMYSSMMYPAIDKRLLQVQKRRDKRLFFSEYGAEFSDSIMAWIEDEKMLLSCISNRSPRTRGDVGEVYFVGVDYGPKIDGTAVGIVHKDSKTNKIIVDYADVWYSQSSDVWEIESCLYRECTQYSNYEFIPVSSVAKHLYELSKWWPTKRGWFDQYNGYGLYEEVQKLGLRQYEMELCSDGLNAKIYQIFKMLISDNLIDFYDHPVLIPELLSLESEIRTKNRVLVRAPKKRGAHDDLSDAVARAVYACYQFYNEGEIHVTTSNRGFFNNQNAGWEMSSLRAYQMKKQKMHGINPRIPRKNNGFKKF